MVLTVLKLRRSFSWSPNEVPHRRHKYSLVPKRKFWNPKKWFRKKQKTSDDSVAQPQHQEPRDGDGARSRSTGELSTDEEPSRSSHEVRNSTSMHPGLSVSHDSVFHPLNSGSSDLELDGAQSSSSLSISQPLGDPRLQTELSSRLQLRRGRGDTSEDDEGLPRSPPCGSPAAATDSFLILEKTVNKDLPTKSHSTCSDGSLLSMDSSEMEEDSVGLPSRHSSRVSLNEKRIETESDLELGPSFSSTPLNHSAAHHRVSVRPKRTYGAPRRKKGQRSIALPATPEVNEESSTRSISPESVTTEPITELYSSTAWSKSTLITHHYENKLKCNSLPAGATPPTSDSFRLSRSKSNAGKSHDDASLHGDEKEEKLSLFERLFPRRSGKKKKKEDKIDKKEIKEETSIRVEVDGSSYKRVSEDKTSYINSASPANKPYSESKTMMSHSHVRREDIKPIVAPRTGAASRQRVQPIDIPLSPKDTQEPFGTVPISPTSPERLFNPGTSPIQAELENVLKQRQMSQTTPNLKEPPVTLFSQTSNSSNVPVAPSSPKKEHVSYISRSSCVETKRKSKTSTEEIRSKIKIAGLSSLQERVLSLNSATEEQESYKSLTDFSPKPNKLIAKSHSFKNQKVSIEKPFIEEDEEITEKRKSVTKAASLDSVKNIEEPVLKSELQLILQTAQKAAGKETDVEEIVLATEKTSPPEGVESTQQNMKQTSEQNKITLPEDNFSLKETEKENNLPNINQINIQEEKPKCVSENKSSIVTNTHSSDVFEEHSVKTNNDPIILPTSFGDSITISGPSHTAIVNVTSKSEDYTKSSVNSNNDVIETEGSKTIVHKESQVSVTKIQLKHETTQITRSSVTVPKQNVPEFLSISKHLNKVDTRPTSNIIFSMRSPKVTVDDAQTARPKTISSPVSGDLERPKLQFPRKFSKEDVEIIEKNTFDNKESKDVSPPKTPTLVTPLTPTQNRFKKNDSRPSSRKSSVISITPESPVKESMRDRALKTRSISLDSLKADQSTTDSVVPDKSSQDSLDKLEKKTTETVVLRRKSLVKQKNDEEPELMKVFARRSLKLKDSDVEQIQEAIAEDNRQRDSDKENNIELIPDAEKKILLPKEDKTIADDISEAKQKSVKKPLNETKKLSDSIKNTTKEEPEVQLRKTLNNNVFLSTQRTVSMSSPKSAVTEFHVKKQPSLSERRKTEQWVNVKKEENIQEKKTESEIITNISMKTEEIRTESKNFSQRRAEWEKRVQQAQK